METVSSVLAERQLQQKKFLTVVPDQPKAEEHHETLADEIIISIRNFFGLRRRHL